MKKVLLLKLSILAICAVGFLKSNGQSINVVGPRLVTCAPSPITNIIEFSLAATQGTGWGGGDITTPITCADLVKAVDSEACTALTNPTVVAGKWVLIYRGNCEFGQKALFAQNANAAGVIIWNHTPMAPLVNMNAGSQGANVNIPVLFISHEDGKALSSELSAGHPVTISLTKWGFNKAHDLAIVANSPALPPAMAIPANQFDGQDVKPYRGYSGGFIANLGLSTEANVMMINKVNWTPTGGSASTVFEDTMVIPSFTPADSLFRVTSAKHFMFNPQGNTGRFDFTYTAQANDPEDLPADNTETFTMHVTQNAYCKGNFDVNTQSPIINGQYRIPEPAGGDIQRSVWGPIFYVRKGNYTIEGAKFSVTKIVNTTNALGTIDTNVKSLKHPTVPKQINLYVFKWKDANSNSIMEGGEFTLVSIGVKEFQEADSNNGKVMFTCPFGDAINGSGATISTEDDTWYWIAADLSNTFAVGADGFPNYYIRSRASKAVSASTEFWGPRFVGSAQNVKSPSIVYAIPYNFLGYTSGSPTYSGEIDSASYFAGDGFPNIAMFTSVFPTTAKDKGVVTKDQVTVYPNPATDKVTVKLNLEAKSQTVSVRIIDAFGRTVTVQEKANMQSGEVSFSTSELAAGNYYIIMNSDNNALARPFTIVR